MDKLASIWRTLGVLAVLASCGLGAFAGAGDDKKSAPKPLPPEIVKAWRGSGLYVGWMEPTALHNFRHKQELFKPQADDLPGLRFFMWKAGVLAKLPDPGVPFGLFLAYEKVTDAGLKELAGLKSMRALSLFGTEVTGVGLKELVGLKDLQTLSLLDTPVTDAGLKELAGLKHLRALTLGTRVTDQGLKELAGLKNLKTLALYGPKVTAAGVAALQKDLPGCKITLVDSPLPPPPDPPAPGD